VIYVARQL